MPRKKKSDTALLGDMLQAAERITTFAAGKSYEDYAADLLLQSGIERQIEIIGEAARCVSESYKTAHPEIPWHGIITQRHVLAHEYGNIQHSRIWLIITTHSPKLAQQLKSLIASSPDAQVK